jgi:hypothetical protein
MLSVIMLSVIMLNVLKLNVVMLRVVAPFLFVSHKQPSLIFEGFAGAYPYKGAQQGGLCINRQCPLGTRLEFKC